MESLKIISFSLKIQKDHDKNCQPWIYCVFRWSDQMFCTRNKENLPKDWNMLILSDSSLQMEFPRNHNLFKVQVWDYDRQEKLAETTVTNGDLPINESKKEFSMNDRKIYLKFEYERKGRVQQKPEVENATLRISYNRSDANLQTLFKQNSTNLINFNKATSTSIDKEKNQITSNYGKWKFIPRSDSASQKLKL